MTQPAKAAHLLRDGQPGHWPEATVWEVFAGILERHAPIAGMAEALAEHRDLFRSVYGKIAHEHSFCTARYYRAPDRKPLVNPLNIEHLTRLLHMFSRRLFLADAPEALLDSLFFVMKSQCCLNIFYRTQEIDFFMPMHALGSVVGYGEFGPFIAMTQNCTIGHNHGHYPTIAGGLWMGPGSAILGNSRIGHNVRIAANALVVDRVVPDDVVVFGVGTDIKFKPNERDNRLMALDGGFNDLPPDT